MSITSGAVKKYPADMDPECERICDALNNLPGVTTTESCCGHAIKPFLVVFSARKMSDLARIVECTSYTSWYVEAHWASGSGGMYFCLVGPTDPRAGDVFAALLTTAENEGER